MIRANRNAEQRKCMRKQNWQNFLRYGKRLTQHDQAFHFITLQHVRQQQRSVTNEPSYQLLVWNLRRSRSGHFAFVS
jgi:hypothetical protein